MRETIKSSEEPSYLELSSSSKLEACNGGLFVSSGWGSHPARILDSFELILLRSGTLQLREEQSIFNLIAGDSLVLWPHRHHAPVAPYDRDTSFYWVHFFLRTQLRTNSPTGAVIPQYTHLSEPLRLVELFHRFLDDQENGWLEANYASSLLKLMLFEVASQAGWHANSQNKPRNLASVAQFVITRAFREPITTAEVAARLNCNPDYLGRTYRACYGLSLTDGIHRIRMQHAKNLLLMTSLNVKEISVACGYADPDYFRRIFRRHFDMQPKQFRSLHLRQHTNAS
ncbi:MAG: helix-turn-helix transcriptional regulator [Chthoniobacterales bacterium]